MLKALCTVGKGSWAGAAPPRTPWKQPAASAPRMPVQHPGSRAGALRGPAAQPSSLRPLPPSAAFRGSCRGRSLINTLHATFLRDGFPENPIAAVNERFPWWHRVGGLENLGQGINSPLALKGRTQKPGAAGGYEGRGPRGTAPFPPGRRLRSLGGCRLGQHEFPALF